jgi:hypothetical protein
MQSADESLDAYADWLFEQQIQGLDTSAVRGGMAHLQSQLRQAAVPPIGGLASVRPDGVIQVMYCQVNSLSVGTTCSEKIRRIVELIHRYEVDGVTLCETGINWSVGPSSRDLKSFFDPFMDREIRSSTSHNAHGPKVSPLQQGGTAILLTSTLLQYSHRHLPDWRRLGRWSSWSLYRNPEHRTRIVVAYSPGTRRNGPKTVYQQQMAYINTHRLNSTPTQLFITDLTAQLKSWIGAGERIILFIDANEPVTRGIINNSLSSIGLNEITHRFWDPGVEPNTHINGSCAIDGIFTTRRGNNKLSVPGLYRECGRPQDNDIGGIDILHPGTLSRQDSATIGETTNNKATTSTGNIQQQFGEAISSTPGVRTAGQNFIHGFRERR